VTTFLIADIHVCTVKIFKELVTGNFSTRKLTLKHKERARKYKVSKSEINCMYIGTS
jgi:hypothetical protein